jgi:hypothetical protein
MFLFQNNAHGDLQIKYVRKRVPPPPWGHKIMLHSKLKNLLVQLDKHGGALGEHCCAMSSWKLHVKLKPRM